ncbi:hypothetical protein [Phenylobacterium sp.]|uniref:hypothetical protein n=1 Tax=Phenylobacterium sp. TaxID=1871053 RepID=UPI00289E10B4|nr:hypothetical protein [Phenylobacterium sp.]
MATPAHTGADFYLHVRVIIGLVIGLSITRSLAGFSAMVQHPGRRKLYPIHLGWAVSILLSAAHFWWWEFRLSGVSWTFALYAFVLAYASLYYFLTCLLFPDDLADYGGFEDFFISRRKWFFGLLALTYVADVVDTAIKGHDYLAHLGWEYPLRCAVYVVLCAIAMFTTNRRFHAAFVIANLAYQVSFILRLYYVEV